MKKKHSNKIVIISVNLIAFISIISVFIFVVYKSIQYTKNVVITHVFIKGVNPYIEEIISQNLILIKNRPFSQIDIEALDNYVSSFPWVNNVSVYRNMNGYIEIFVQEKNPYFLWKDENDFYRIIDSRGEILSINKRISTKNFIIINASKDIIPNSSLIRFIIYDDLNILQMIKELSYNGYRWDIILKNGIIIKMPEENIQQAFKLVIRANNKYKLLYRDISYVDVTTFNKIYVK